MTPRHGPSRTIRPALLLCVLTGLSTACAWMPSGSSEEPPRQCEELDPASLPSVEAFLDRAALLDDLRAAPDTDPVQVTVATTADGDEIRLFGPVEDADSELGSWLVPVRRALRTPPPEGASPGVRVRLTPGSAAAVALEPPTFCAAQLLNRAEIRERYLDRASDAGGPVELEVELGLSDRGGIRRLDLEIPEGAEEHDLLARRALRFARFEPALLDGQPVPSTVRMRFPRDGEPGRSTER